MKNSLLGLHHITAIASNAQQNFDFYTKVLGLRLVKKTVNFDDPGSYHLYYGDELGSAGTITTFFAWENLGPSREGVGMATEIGYAVPKDSFNFWNENLQSHNIFVGEPQERFGQRILIFKDTDGLSISLIEADQSDQRIPWETERIKKETATKGFHSTTLTLSKIDEKAKLLTDVFGYWLVTQKGNKYRFITDSVETAAFIDLLESPTVNHGITGAGTIHHVAFRVKDEKAQMEVREKILSRNLHVTPKIDRDYFYSLYFREPGGVLFEIATENPGFTIDESQEELGTHLMLPLQHQVNRKEIEKALPILRVF